MKQIATFDAAQFGADVRTKLERDGRSYRQFVDAHPWISRPAISRAVNAKPLCVANFLALCDVFALDPKVYFSKQNQVVSVVVSRETRGVAAILESMRGRT